MKLFIFEGFKAGKESRKVSEQLVTFALSLYLDSIDKSIETDEMKIKKTATGKPYFDNIAVEFSVSHTGQLWMCAMSEQKVGIDVQIVKNTDYEKIAKRYFSKEEQHYCELWGVEGFFRIWVRKEAAVKYLGTTLGQGISGYETVKDGELSDTITVNANNRDYSIQLEEIEISPDIKCAVAMEEKEIVCVMTIN